MPSISEAEAFGIVQIEAMAAGLPVVNTSLSTAVPHIARNGIEGLTVPPNNSDALADALRHLLDHPALAEQMGAAARSRAKAEYRTKIFERINAVYQRFTCAWKLTNSSRSLYPPDRGRPFRQANARGLNPALADNSLIH
jgi:rhamnosyl/mannosyltransferase